MEEKQKNKTLLVVVSLLFIFLMFSYSRNRDSQTTGNLFGSNKEENKVIVKNFAFNHIVNDSIELSGKAYGLKTLTTKKENDIETTYYQNDEKMYIKENDEFVKYEGNFIENIDNKFFDILFIESLLNNEDDYTVEDKTESTMKVHHKEENLYITMYYDNNQEWYKMLIEKEDFKIETRYFDSDKIEDFDISVK